MLDAIADRMMPSPMRPMGLREPVVLGLSSVVVGLWSLVLSLSRSTRGLGGLSGGTRAVSFLVDPPGRDWRFLCDVPSRGTEWPAIIVGSVSSKWLTDLWPPYIRKLTTFHVMNGMACARSFAA